MYSFGVVGRNTNIIAGCWKQVLKDRMYILSYKIFDFEHNEFMDSHTSLATYMKKDKLTRMFSTECCRELTIESGSSGAESQFAGFHGHYEFKFKKANLVQIKKGFFVYKKTRKAKYIFKSQDGIWMVRYLNYLLICRCPKYLS